VEIALQLAEATLETLIMVYLFDAGVVMTEAACDHDFRKPPYERNPDFTGITANMIF
jgi:hypothetical protein